MDIFVYQAALYCFECGEKIGIELNKAGKGPKNPSQEDQFPFNDSSNYPQGPYPDGGGESYSPEHCDNCQLFLENPLTTDGYDSVKEMIGRYICNKQGNLAALLEWIEFYDITLRDLL